MSNERRAADIKGSLDLITLAASALETRLGIVSEKIDRVDKNTAGVEVMSGPEWQAFIDEEISTSTETIAAAVEAEMNSLAQILKAGSSAEEGGEETHTDLREVVADVEALAATAADEIDVTLERGVEVCSERLANVLGDLNEAANRWASQLAETAQSAEQAFDELDADAVGAWSDASEQLQKFIQDSSANLHNRIGSIRGRIGKLSDRIEDGVAALSTTQRSSAVAMGATQAPLGICLGIIDDTRAIFSGL